MVAQLMEELRRVDLLQWKKKHCKHLEHFKAFEQYIIKTLETIEKLIPIIFF